MTKFCNQCKKDKPIEEFGLRVKTSNRRHGECRNCAAARSRNWVKENYALARVVARRWRAENLECARAATRRSMAALRKAHPERVKESARRWYAKNKEKIREGANRRSLEWYYKNKKRALAYSREYVRNRRAKDLGVRALHNLRARVRRALHGIDKSARTKDLIGCSVDQLLGQIEIQFEDGMAWKNYGQWHIDHKRPCASFDLSDPAQQRECFNYKNLQPLWATDNIRKSDKWLP